jgi:antitoxin HigA-1
MNEQLAILKGIHPGFVLERELKQRNLPKVKFANLLNEFPQTLVSITKGKRKMNTALSLKIENALNLEEGFLMTLQLFYDIEQVKKITKKTRPNLKKLRPVLFWDTNINNIDWLQQKKAVINRVFERGNEQEKNEIIRFYGETVVNQILV